MDFADNVKDIAGYRTVIHTRPGPAITHRTYRTGIVIGRNADPP